MTVAAYDAGTGTDGGPPPTGGLWATFDFATTDAVVAPPSDPPSPPDPDDPFTPPARSNTITNAPSGTTVVTDTYYLNPQGSLVFPSGIEHVTVVGAKTIPTICAGWRDVHIQGTPSAYAQSGPRTDGRDLLQIKRADGGGQLPADIVIRYWYGHDVNRSGNPSGHPDGVQIMGGSRITFVDCLMERVAVQPYFVKPEGPAIGGLTEDITFLRCVSVADGVEGYYSFQISQTSSGTAAYRVKIIDCSGDRPVNMDANVVTQGGEVINWTAL